MLIEVMILRMHVSPLRFVGVGVAMVEVYLIIQRTTAVPESHQLEGDLLLMGAGLVWALYNFATRGVAQRYSMSTVIVYQSVVGAITFLPLALVEHHAWRPLGLQSLLSAAYLGAFCSLAAFLLYGRGLRSLDAGSATGLMNLVPVFGLGLAIVGLGDPISVVQILGGLVVMAGVALSIQIKPRTSDAPSPIEEGEWSPIGKSVDTTPREGS